MTQYKANKQKMAKYKSQSTPHWIKPKDEEAYTGVYAPPVEWTDELRRGLRSIRNLRFLTQDQLAAKLRHFSVDYWEADHIERLEKPGGRDLVSPVELKELGYALGVDLRVASFPRRHAAVMATRKKYK